MIYPRTHVGCFLFFSFLFPLQLLCVGVKRPPPQERKKHISFFFSFFQLKIITIISIMSYVRTQRNVEHFGRGNSLVTYDLFHTHTRVSVVVVGT